MGKEITRRFISDGLPKINKTHIVLTRRGLYVSDIIMSELPNA